MHIDLKNPLIVAIIAGILTYIFMYIEKKYKYKNQQIIYEKISITTPLFVSLLTWLIFSYIYKPTKTTITNVLNTKNIKLSNPIEIQKAGSINNNFDTQFSIENQEIYTDMMQI